jgi:ribosomal protein S18 acetylase RimI-like enzyme
MSIEVVYITQAHADGFHACLDAVARERKFLAQFQAPPKERIRALVSETIANGTAQFVAVDGSSVVGWCDIFPASAGAAKHCGSLGMGLLPAYRGRGIGRALIEAAVAHARANGLTRIELEVREDNSRAIELYAGSGFVEEGRKKKSRCVDGQYYDTILMALVYA